MRERIAVLSSLQFSTYLSLGGPLSLLKRYALMFDRIALPDCAAYLEPVEKTRERLAELLGTKLDPKKRADSAREWQEKELIWLIDKGIVFDPEELISKSDLIEDREIQEYSELRKFHVSEVIRVIRENEKALSGNYKESPIWDQVKSNTLGNFYKSDEYRTRAVGVQLKKCLRADACPVLFGTLQPSENIHAKKDEVIQIIINALPIPSDSVSWEQILEYRTDSESKSKFLALKNWMTDIGKANLTAIEIEEKLEYLIDQYHQHMKLHKLKSTTGTLGAVMTISLGLVENVIKLKLESFAKGLFALKHRKIELIEGELKAPGNEIAYIVKTNEKFI
jgi:hypothetical protein